MITYLLWLSPIFLRLTNDMVWIIVLTVEGKAVVTYRWPMSFTYLTSLFCKCRWISVLNNAKESVLMKAFGEASSSSSGQYNQSVKELTRTILAQAKRLPGNQICCDCGASGTISTNVPIIFMYFVKIAMTVPCKLGALFWL